MSENPQPEQPQDPSVIPAGYDGATPAAPAAPAYGEPTAPAYGAPAQPAPDYNAPAQQPAYGAPAGQQYPQQGYQQQGYQQQGYAVAPGYEQKSKLVAGILGILLGSLGIHRFYLGHTKIGVIQIIVSVVTFGIGGIWGFIEGIMILVGADPFKTDANGVPLKD